MYKGGLYLAIGDSITWTGPATGDELYANRIWKAINANYAPIRYLNKGTGGITSTRLLASLRWAANVVPDLVTIGVGMNDCANNSVPLATYNSNLSQIIDFLRQRNPNVHIILCTPSRTSDASRSPYVQSYRDEMAAVATAKNVSLCRFENAFTEGQIATYTSDGIHPNGSGHQLLYNQLWTVVQQGSWLNRLNA